MILTVLLFLIVLSGILAFYLNRTGVPRTVWTLAFAAFAARVGYVFADSLLGIYSGGGDQGPYDETFWFIAQQWRAGVIFAPLQYGMSPGNDGYYMLLYSAVYAPAYAVFGHVTLLPRLQMSMIGALVVVNIYLISRYVFDHQAGIVAGTLSAFFPYWVVLSGIIYRDMFVIFLFTAMAYFLVRWQSGEKQLTILALIAATAILAASLRLENVIAVGALLAAAGFLFVGRNPKGYLVLLGASAIMSFTMYHRFGERILVQGLAGRRLWLSRPNPGSYLSGFTYESFFELIVFAPIGALYFTLVPFPWHVIDLMAVIAIAQNLLIWYPVLVLSIMGFRDLLHVPSGTEMVVPLVAFSLAGIFGYGLVEGNIGPAVRHRSQFQFVFFVLAAVAITKRFRVEGLTFPSGG